MKKEQDALNYLYTIALTKTEEDRDKKIKATQILQHLIDTTDYVKYCAELYDE